ncbi:hypothetical protein K3495_g1661 [Podosphaera aphanis]|nr:hypothetical protein K3495_g1661 [Podosphaera aphanis]
MSATKQEMGKQWEATDLGEPMSLIGVQVERDAETKAIKIYREQYILKSLKRFHVEICSRPSTPLPVGTVFLKSDEEEAFEDTTKYRAAIGSLMFASVATRPYKADASNLLN